jgi:hypothetical protein
MRLSCRLFACYWRLCCVGLVLTAALKLLSALGDGPALSRGSFAQILTNRQLLFLAALLELATVAGVWNVRDSAVKALLLGWIGSCFAVWRLGMHFAGYGPCMCIGTAYDWLGLDPSTVEIVLQIFVGFLIIGSLLGLIAEGTKSRPACPQP